MKNVVAGVAFIMALAFGAKAQDAKTEGKRHHKGKHHKQVAFHRLNLTDAQKEHMRTSRSEFHTRMTDLRKNEDITVKERREKRTAIIKEQKAAVDRILTAEQKSKLVDMKKESSGRKNKNRRNIELMQKELSLTDSQRARLKEANKNFHNKVSDIRNNTSLESKARKEQIASLRKQQKAEINSILTVEQQTKLKELRSSRSGRNRAR